MSITNYPYGVSSFGIPLIGSGPIFSLGNVWFVNSAIGTDSAGYGSDKERPFDTIAFALNQAAAGDIIIVAEGHTETISDATSFALDTARVTVIGMGHGNNRPTITLDTATTTTIPVSAANVTLKNLIFTANFADIVAFFTLTTAKFFRLDGCYFKATATNMNCLYVVDTNATTADADGLTIINCKWIEPDAATVSLIKADGTNDSWTIKNNFLSLGVNNNKASLAMIAAGKILTNLDCGYNVVLRLNTDTATGAILFHTDGSTNTGMIYGNFVQHADTAAELLITASAGWGTFQNFASGVPGASGYLLPAADS